MLNCAEHLDVNVILVSYAELGVNSTQHVLSFARGLANLGVDVFVGTLKSSNYRDGFRFMSVGARGNIGAVDETLMEAADIVHLWTPRGAIWHFLDRYCHLINGTVVMHLEDDETAVLKAFSGRRKINPSWWKSDGLEARGLSHLSHPLLGRCLVACADAITVLSPELLRDVPVGIPTACIRAPLDACWYEPHSKARPLPGATSKIVYAGGVHAAVAHDFRALCAAVGMLNRRGRRVQLVRCGPASVPPKLISAAAKLSDSFEDVGFLSENALRELMSEACALVQPGEPTDFNRRRLPAKLAPYLASGVPVILPACYAWLGIVHREHAWLLQTGTPEEIADAIGAILDDSREAELMGDRGAEWAKRIFHPELCCQELLGLYRAALSAPKRLEWNRLTRPMIQLPMWLAAHSERQAWVSPFELQQFCREAAGNSSPKVQALTCSGAPLVSVIVPNYNHRRYLPDRMRSIFEQTYQNIEIVFLDDASTDGSLEWLAEQESPFPLRVVANAQNSGSVFSQWQRGLNEARGELIWIAESDDDSESRLLARLVDAISVSKQVGIAYAQSLLIDESGHEVGGFREATDEIDATHWHSDYLSSGRDELRRYLIIRNTIPNASACLFRRRALEQACLESIDLRVCGDWLAYARILNSYDVAFVSDALNRYRRHSHTVRTRAIGNGILFSEMYKVQTCIRNLVEVPDQNRRDAAEFTAREIARALVRYPELSANILTSDALLSAALEFDSRFWGRISSFLLKDDVKNIVTRSTSSSPVDCSSLQWRTVKCEMEKVPSLILSNGPGTVAFRRIRQRDVSSGEVLWSADGIAEYRQIQIGKGAYGLASAEGLEVVVTGSEAVLSIPAPAESNPSVNACDIEFQCRRGQMPREIDPEGNNGKRLVLLVPHLELGGADRFNLDLIRQLSTRFGWRISVVTTRRAVDLWEAEFRRQTDDVVCLHRFAKVEEYPAFLEQFLRSRRADAMLISHSAFGYRLAKWLRGRLPFLPLLDLVHIVTPEWNRGGYPRMSVQLCDVLDRTICTSSHLRNWMIKEGASGDRVDVCYTNVNTDTWRRSSSGEEWARRTWSLPLGQTLIVFSGRLCDQKQTRLLPEIVGRLLERRDDFLLAVAGDGPDEPWLKREFSSKFPFNTRMVGPLSSDQLGRLYSAASILLLPSRNEGIALTLFEAMSAEVVPVATDVGGQCELVTPDTGVLIPLSKSLVRDVVRALEDLLDSPSRMNAIATAARKRVSTFFSLDEMGNCLQRSIEQAIADANVRRSLPFTSADLKESFDSAVRTARAENASAAVWIASRHKGKQFPRIATQLAKQLRALPVLGPVASNIEQRFGDKIGRWIMRFI